MTTAEVNHVYYNENDPYAAAWLRNLIDAGHIPAGEVDERDIRDVEAADLAGFQQCHFFAGVAGWSLALRLAGWPEDNPVWTGSCPCQPFSGAGQRKGHADERHLWPAFYALISECEPATIFGEQVASALGREWLAGIRADLEAVGYAVGAADLCAASAGAPHIRQRLFWVADANKPRSQGRRILCECRDKRASRTTSMGFWQDSDLIPCADGKMRRIEPGIQPLAHGISNRVGRLRAYGNAIVPQVAAGFIKSMMGALG